MDKRSFLLSITNETIFDSEFHKKVYGYSVLDQEFTHQVARVLLNHLGRQDVVNSFNSWLINYNKEQSIMMKSIASWYVKECEKQYQSAIRKEQVTLRKDIEIPSKVDVRSCEEWQKKRKELLLQKKKLIIMQNLQQSIGN